jgi:hypothetical protein
MAGHGISWIPGTHVCFDTLGFIVIMEEELVRALALAQPPLTTNLDAIVEALEELQLHAPEACAPRGDQLVDFDFGRLEHQFAVFLGPHPSQEDLCNLTFSFVNVMT